MSQVCSIYHVVYIDYGYQKKKKLSPSWTPMLNVAHYLFKLNTVTAVKKIRKRGYLTIVSVLNFNSSHFFIAKVIDVSFVKVVRCNMF